jgi:N-acetyl-anhydromuramyl-L-alanine amidase AmpD
MARNFGRPIKRIILHCTSTSQNATVEAIKRYWRDVLGWIRAGGYHYIIGVNGERHILHHLSQVTNGVYGFNKTSVHIAYIGGKYGDDRTPAQKREMKKLIQELRSDKILGPIPVYGHRDMYGDTNRDGIIDSRDWKKLCPNFDVETWLKEDSVI